MTAWGYVQDGYALRSPLEGMGEPATAVKQLEVVKLPVDDACLLNGLWHSRLPYIHPSNVLRNTRYGCWAAVYEGAFYGVGIWSTPVAANRMKDGALWLELRRLAIPDYAPKCAATWLMARMIRAIRKEMPEIVRLVSYQDTVVHSGTIYKAGNWIKASETKFMDWNGDRRRRKAQSTAPKVRWEYEMR